MKIMEEEEKRPHVNIISILELRGIYVRSFFLCSGNSMERAVSGVSIPEPESEGREWEHINCHLYHSVAKFTNIFIQVAIRCIGEGGCPVPEKEIQSLGSFEGIQDI